MTPQTLTAPRTGKRTKTNPSTSGLPDPRPITGYTAEYHEPDGHSRIYITLDAPCIIRSPAWMVIDVVDGSALAPDAIKATGPTEFYLDFEDIIPLTVCLVDVPYQDMEVQNFQGGFVSPGARWFRSPI